MGLKKTFHPCLKLTDDQALIVLDVGSREIRIKSAIVTTVVVLSVSLGTVLFAGVRRDMGVGRTVEIALKLLPIFCSVPAYFWLRVLWGKTRRLVIHSEQRLAEYVEGTEYRGIAHDSVIFDIKHIMAGSAIPNYYVDIHERGNEKQLCQLMTHSQHEAEKVRDFIQSYLNGDPDPV